MSKYFDRLKQLETEKNSLYSHRPEVPKLPKAPFVSFVSTPRRANVKKYSNVSGSSVDFQSPPGRFLKIQWFGESVPSRTACLLMRHPCIEYVSRQSDLYRHRRIRVSLLPLYMYFQLRVVQLFSFLRKCAFVNAGERALNWIGIRQGK